MECHQDPRISNRFNAWIVSLCALRYVRTVHNFCDKTLNIPAFSQGRATCYRCFTPIALCYCNELVAVENTTRIYIAQHPKEQFHPLNTARIVERSLTNSCRVVAHTDRLGEALVRAGLSSDAAVLYPSADAELLDDIEPTKFPREILILDGTWHQAKTLLRDVPLLAKMRRVRFIRELPSEYQIRKEPKKEYLSTVESVHHVLSCLEPATENIENLLTVFRKMIAQNIAARRDEGRSARYLSRSKVRQHRFPELLASDPAQFVAVYGEGTSRLAWTVSGPAKEPFWIGMERPFLRSEPGLSLVLKTNNRPPERLKEYLSLSDEDIDNASTLDAARAQIETFIQPDDIVCVWNSSSLKVLNEIGIQPRFTLLLKGTYCDYMRYQHFAHDHPQKPAPPKTLGDLEDAITRHKIAWQEPHLSDSAECGRGLSRTRKTAALNRWLYNERLAQTNS